MNRDSKKMGQAFVFASRIFIHILFKHLFSILLIRSWANHNTNSVFYCEVQVRELYRLLGKS